MPREEARGSPKPGAQIQERHSLLQSELRSEVLGCRPPADVELVDGGEVIWLDVISVATHGFETGKYRRLQAPMAVMLSDLLFETPHSQSGAQAARFPALVSAVVGSITRSTFVILLAGNPLRSA